MQADLHDVHVPIELFSKIDGGQNPQLYTREFMEQALAKNEAVRGKLESLRRFRALLIAELSRHFPNEMAKYRAVRGDPEAPNTAPAGVLSGNSQSNGSGTETGPDSAATR
ncbi:hypothetical protein CRM22_002025 [Opisthorchis felineus]|uniref:Mediator of RNA polymerase II transcription subunit 10 n=1 Tax=Opisthorchis felineus TaxID=147828 RepID=A0A4S2MCC1_OPIFE|nr:hypothetical protein CRM22_002025 [Opisthorchis felineus]